MTHYVFIVRHVPDWLPGTSFKQKAAKWRKTVEQLRDEPYETIKSQIVGDFLEPGCSDELTSTV